MPSTVDTFASVALAVVVIGGAIGVVSTRNVVHAAFWMLASMVGSAGLYLLLSAPFLALVQVMVYAGAVAVLLLFVVMLTLRDRDDAIRPRDFSYTALIIAMAFFGTAVALVHSWSPSATSFPAVVPGIAEFGVELFTTWLLPFELASLVLTVALVGAVWWSVGRRDK